MSKEEYRNLNALASIALIIYLKEKQDLLVKEGDLGVGVALGVLDTMHSFCNDYEQLNKIFDNEDNNKAAVSAGCILVNWITQHIMRDELPEQIKNIVTQLHVVIVKKQLEAQGLGDLLNILLPNGSVEKETDPVLAKHIATDVIDLLFERAKRSKT